MSGFNLPPGCTESMIPGNTPDDAEWEQFAESEQWPEDVVKVIFMPELTEGNDLGERWFILHLDEIQGSYATEEEAVNAADHINETHREKAFQRWLDANSF